MKNLKILCLLFIFISFFTISFSFTILQGDAYYGDGYCPDYHGVSYIEVPKIEDAYISLDGKNNEPLWEQGVFKSIKLSEERTGEDIPEMYTLNTTFVRNDEYLFIFCEWKDLTPNSTGHSPDGLSFCWDINTKSFSAYYSSEMNTLGMGGGKVDVWSWFYRDGYQGIAYACNDECYDENGWVNQEGLKDVFVAFDYSTHKKAYSLEIRRKLTTIEDFDVQYDNNKGRYYKFNIGLFNDSHGSEHAISWTYALDLGNLMKYIPYLMAIQLESNSNKIPGFFLPIITISIIFIIFLTLILNKKVNIIVYNQRYEN
jgi:hypothetical protein